MNSTEAERLELTTASYILVQVIKMMEQKHEREDVQAATQAVLARALQMANLRRVKSIEELYEDL